MYCCSRQFTVTTIQRFITILLSRFRATLDSNVANEELKKDFDMSNMHMIMMDKNMDAKDKQEMLNED